ncbi:SUMF1/EgtB/PvdO family nonheme iron enzyme [Myxococcota bacterium]|nr:SUMF1/EgtB/PvdO family nonheme iron enzyme [Myxococcota bacterium]
MKNRTILLTLIATCLMLVACDTKTKTVDSCGDGFLDPGEVCDGSEMTATTCAELGYYDQQGILTCKSDCTFNLAVCTGGRCGDGTIQGLNLERCDGENLDDQTCETQGLGGGTLSCKATCRFDVSRCELSAECGDDVAASPFEPCDGTDLDGQTCVSRGFYRGVLACDAECTGFDTSGCTNCGNGEVDDGETCDGTNLDGKTCLGLGYSGGTLGCTAICGFDLTGCEAPVTCGNGQLDTGEQCDGTLLNGQTCLTQGFVSGTLTCNPNCSFSTSGCTNCGNGTVDTGEACDGANLNAQTCVTQGFGQASGALGCTAGCAFNEAACVAKSTNADLATLTVSAGTLTPAFSPSTTSYGVTVPTWVTTLTLAATKANSYASVNIAPAQPMTLSLGANPATVTVTAESGAQKVYTVVITQTATLDYESPNIGTLIYVPVGTFQRDATVTNLSLVSAFRMSQYEITRAQWTAVTGWADPSNTTYSSGTSDPVQQVSWYDAIAFCNKLSILEGLTPVYAVSGVDFSALTYAQIPTATNADWNAATANWAANGYRLPTEMEWMWAAMGADTGAPGVTNTTGYLKAFAGSTGSNAIGDYAWYTTNSASKTHPAGTKLPNELGLYDLSGNVWEWAWDWYASSYPTGTLTDIRGPASGADRVRRGGSWNGSASGCTVAGRVSSFPSFRYYLIGFRVARP